MISNKYLIWVVDELLDELYAGNIFSKTKKCTPIKLLLEDIHSNAVKVELIFP